MSYEIVGESVKSAMSIKLGQIFPDITRYKEAITTLKYPHFFIYQISMETIAQEKNRYILFVRQPQHMLWLILNIRVK